MRQPRKVDTQIWPAAKARMVATSTLKAYSRNPRTHTEAQVKQIAASIEQFGFTNPILVDENMQVIAGHGRLAAAVFMNLSQVPIVTARGWTEEQRRAYVIADNQLALNAGWDESLLRLEVSDLKLGGFDLDLLGFSAKEMDALFPEDAAAEDERADAEAPEAPVDPVARRGDVWLLGRHRIACGDSTADADVARLLLGHKPNLMVTDPPYGVSYEPTWRDKARGGHTKRRGKVQNDHIADWRQAWALFPGDVCYIWHAANHALTVLNSLLACDFVPRAEIIWVKSNHALSRGDYHWKHEPCIYAVKRLGKSNWQGSRTEFSVWPINSSLRAKEGEDIGTVHGTQKPVECMRKPILNNTAEGDWVYEPFSGSGTTIIAAEVTGRACLAMELDPAYVDVAIERWQGFTGQTATLEATGETFETARASRLEGKSEAA